MKRIITSFLFLTMCVLMGFAQSLKLNGVDQYMAIPNDAAFFPETGGGYTVTFKVKLEDYLQNNARFIGARTYVGSTSNNSTTGYEIWGAKSADEFMAANFSLEKSPWGHGCAWANAGALNEFVHVAFVVRPANKETAIYINAKQNKVQSDKAKAENITNTSWGNHGKDILVGAGWQEVKSGDAISGESVVGYFAKCEIDDVHFYNKALNTKTIKQDMNSFAATAANLVAAYDFENIQGTTVPDVSGHGHDAVVYNLEAAPAMCLVTTAASSSEGYLTMKDGENVIFGGTEVAAGTELTLVANLIDETYELDYFTANGQRIEGNTYVVNGDVEFGVVFKKIQAALHMVTLADVPEEGYMKVTYADTGDTVWGGTNVADGTLVKLIANPFTEDFVLDYFTANGQRIEGDTYVVKEDVQFGVVFKSADAVPSEPTYAVPEGDRNLRQNVNEWGQVHSREYERILYTFAMKGNTNQGVAADFNSTITQSGAGQKYVFIDRTAEVADLTAGDKISVEMTHGIEWMHGYLYIDYDHDGTFDQDTELVSFSHFSATNTDDGVNSLGEPTKSNCGIALPDFTVKADAQDVTTRMRLKIDWNSKDPVGNPSQSIGANAGYVVDFTVNVHAAASAVKNYAVNFEQPVAGGSFKVMNGEVEVTSGTEVEEGTVLTIVPTAEPGYKCTGFQVNDEASQDAPAEGAMTFTVNAETNLKVFFAQEEYTITAVAPEHGQMKVYMKTVEGEVELLEGVPVHYGEELRVEALPDAGYEVELYIINGVPQTEETVIVTGNTTIGVIFKEVPVVEPEYAIPEGDDNIRAKADGTVRFSERLLHTVTVEGATLNGEAAPFTSTINEVGGRQENVFVDKTAETVELTSGDNIQLTFTHDIIWMHSYLYIDYNHDGVFNEDNELVAYSHFSEADTEDGFNSLGEPTKHDCGIDIPAFTVANVDKDVKTRMRLKIDWNSKNPVGNETQSIGGNAGTIVDFTANVHAKTAAPAEKFAVSFEQPAEGGTFVIMNGETEVVAGEEVEAGTELTVVAAPAEGYKLSSILVNDNALAEGVNTFVVSEATTVVVKFAPIDAYIITYEVIGNGTLQIASGNGDLIENGQAVKRGEEGCMIVVKFDEGAEFVSLKVNGVEKKGSCMPNPFKPRTYSYLMDPITSDTHIVADFGGGQQPEPVAQHTITYSANPATAGSVKVVPTGYDNFQSGDKVDDGTGVGITINVNRGYEISSVLINNVERKDDFQDLWYDGTSFGLRIDAVNEDLDIKVEFSKIQNMHTMNLTFDNEKGDVTAQVLGGGYINDGAQFVDGSKITFAIYAYDGYEVSAVWVNDVDKKAECEYIPWGSYYQLVLSEVKEDLNVKVEFAEEKPAGAVLTYSATPAEGGSVLVRDAMANVIESGAELAKGTENTLVTVNVNEGYKLESVLINNEECKDKFNEIMTRVFSYYIPVINDDTEIVVTFAVETGIGAAALEEVSYNGAAQTLNIPAGATAAVYSAAGQQVMSIEGGQAVSTANLSTGAYVVRVANEAGVKVIKFIKK